MADRYACWVANGVFGRTNESFPDRWLSLVAPEHKSSALALLAQLAKETNTVLDISTSPALWGEYLRTSTQPLMVIGPNDLARSIDENQASILVQAHLVETLCGIGRERIDFYFLLIKEPLQEFQICGALIALEEARQAGNIRFTGIASKDPNAALAIMHLHDAFEAVLIEEEAELAQPIRLLAKSRRMALITRGQARQDEAALISVSSADEVQNLFRQKVSA